VKAVVLVIVAACTDGVMNQVPPDVGPTQPKQHCYGTGLVNVCFDTVSTTTVMLSGTLDTTTSSRCEVAAE
jgi:hypothetical protein